MKKPARLPARGRRRRPKPALNAAAVAYLQKHLTLDTMFTAVLSHLRTQNGDFLLDIARDLSPVDQLQITVSERPSPFRRGKPPGTAPWHEVLDGLVLQRPHATPHDVLTAFDADARERDGVIKTVVRTDRTFCREKDPDKTKDPDACPAGYHAHLRDPQLPESFRPLALKTIKNRLTLLKKRLPPA